MTTQDVVRALTVEDLVVMEIGELQTLVQLGNAALAAKAEQAAQDKEDTIQATKRQRQELLKFEPQVEKCFAAKPVKLNVGGSYFSTSVENLVREPDTFFAAMFSGRWEVKVDPKDDAVFIDRDPTMFAPIVNYMRTGRFVLDNLTPAQLGALREEVDFYQIASLLDQLSARSFFQRTKGKVQLSLNDSRASSTEIETASFVISSKVFSADVQVMKVKVIKGECLMLGVAPKSVLEKGKGWKTCGWYLWAGNGSLCSQNGDKNKPFKHKIQEGSIVTVKLDLEFNISFAVNGEDWGVAYQAVAKDHSTPLHLAVVLSCSGHEPTVAKEGIVELL